MIGKKIEKHKTLNVLYAEEIYPASVSKHTSNCEKQVILLMIPNGVEQCYLAVKKPSTLLRRITSKHHSNFYFLNCLHFFSTENKPVSHKKFVKIKTFLFVVMKKY